MSEAYEVMIAAAAKAEAAKAPELSPDTRERIRDLLWGTTTGPLPSPPPPPPAVAQPQRPPVDPPLSGVYFVRSGDAIKIGVSTNVRSRIKALATGSPVPIELLAVAPGDVASEKRLHRRFAHLRMNGEWFRAEPEIVDFVATLPPPPPELTPREGGRPVTVLTDEQRELLRQAVESAADVSGLKQAAWDAALAARRAGVPDETLCDETGLSRATLNRRFGTRRAGAA